MNRRFARSTGFLASCAAGLALAGCGLTHATSPYDNPAASFGRLKTAFQVTGLHVCSQTPVDWKTQGFVKGTAYVVAADCATVRNNPVASLVTVSQYASARSRDTAEQQANIFVRYAPVRATTVWSYGPYLITVSGARDPGSARIVNDALRNLGAAG